LEFRPWGSWKGVEEEKEGEEEEEKEKDYLEKISNSALCQVYKSCSVFVNNRLYKR
jgi:hypothetical protein